ncbi:DUF6158 family protein [Tomitella fengzijianii]|uniref:Uncharacterized protein n=1 Tax=Tomitella fengzijianii TaxID=2597660 RepID=A0A516WZF8_9ACTN|nr:DUF6158 family protein [Tomitella fengzijianii]QDQ96147.1 hypothetical protein FO059_00780 [Tomitella fengzijianii]
MTAPLGRPARELTDEELEHQGTQAHATRNWVFLHGTAAQFATHTARMLELEQEYIRRFPKRTWQGSGGAPAAAGDEVEQMKAAIAGIVVQLQALLEITPAEPTDGKVAGDPVDTLLRRVAEAPHGRMHKLVVHQAARELGISREKLAELYKGDPRLLDTEKGDRVITEAGKARIAAAAQ